MNKQGKFNICNNQELVLLCSSGMDSLLLLNVALKYNNIVYPIFINSGFPWETMEYSFLKRSLKHIDSKNIRPLKKVTFSGDDLYFNSWMFQKSIPQWENGINTNTIQGRVLYLLTFAFTYAALQNVNNVILGITSHIYYLDDKKEFLENYSSALNLGLGKNIKLYFPLPSASTELICDFVKLNPTINWDLTFSCYNPQDGKPCNNCYKCTERKNKFIKWGIKTI